MFDYNKQITAYQDEKVRLPEKTQKKLRSHRESNQNRLISNIREGISVNKSSFKKQGSYANKTMTQHPENDYDIDDGVVFKRSELKNSAGADLSGLDVRNMVLEALEDDKFDKQPERLKNCVRVYYKEGHHVDVPAYRSYLDDEDNEVIEIASSEWRKSDPTKINRWFDGVVSELKAARDGRGLQFREMVRLLKRFCRSRDSWNMPSGLILTMLTEECLADHERNDECFYYTLQSIHSRLEADLEVVNLADDETPKEKLTKTDDDADVRNLRDKSSEALDKLAVLFESGCTKPEARSAWDWVFKSDGFFEDYDDDDDPDDDPSGSTTKSHTVAFSSPSAPVDPAGGGRYG